MSAGRSRASIRPMSCLDIERVVELATHLRHAPKWAREAYEIAAAQERYIALVAEIGEAIAGLVVVSLAPPEAELEVIAVGAAFRRQGIGKELLDEAVHRAQAAGIREIYLEVRESNREAISLYRRRGFIAVGRRPRYYVDPIEDATLLKLVLV
jgi:[ribosomal protein S18]-alanine N-acetyltransferase